MTARHVTAPRHVTTAVICRAVAAHYGVLPEDITGPSRARSLCRPRHVAMFLARRLGRRTYSLIGRTFDNRDHTTIMHGERVVAARLHQPEIAADLVAIAERIGREVTR